MRNIIKRLFIVGFITSTVACTELDLTQLDAASSGNWYSTYDQFRQSLNEGYREAFWPMDQQTSGMSDDWQRRDIINSIKSGTVSSEYSPAANNWTLMYKIITRMLVFMEELDSQSGVLTESEEDMLRGEANFMRASFWSYLISHYGDVPFYEEEISVDESFLLPRRDKFEILDKIYEYYDDAANALPTSYDGKEYATKGAAYAMKARIALYMGDYETAADAAKQCMDLNVYSLHPDFADLFISATKDSDETIFKFPRSEEFNWALSGADLNVFIPRNHGGYNSRQPSWSLLASFECVDGLPIDESPLFDPRNPFKNRDPRCTMTIVPFGSLEDGDGLAPSDGFNFMGIEYTPHPERKQVMNYSTGSMIRNNDTRSVHTYGSYNGLALRKGVDEDWLDFRSAKDRIEMRYADVLLMYAEAKIELNEIDQSVLDAINEVRDRAYANSPYTNPEVVTTDQAELRLKVRNERRSEFAFEARRYMDLIRWELAEKAMTGPIPGLLNVAIDIDPNVAPTGALMDNVVDPGLWFWGLTPEIDDDGLPDFTALFDAGLCRALSVQNFPARQYLWPIPAEERLLNTNLSQNQGY